MIKVQSHALGLRVLIDDLLHVFIANVNNAIGLRAVHAWHDDETHFFIDYYLTQGSMIHCEYDARSKWEAILQGLNKPDRWEIEQ